MMTFLAVSCLRSTFWLTIFYVMSFSQAVPTKFVCLTNSFLTLIELDMKSSQVVTLCFLEQNQYLTSSFSLICSALIVFNGSFFRCDSCDAIVSTIGLSNSFILFPTQSSNSNRDTNSETFVVLGQIALWMH